MSKDKKEEIKEENPLQAKPDEPQTDFESLYKRALADYQNLEKQSARDRQEFARYANEQLLYSLLPVYDNLKIAMKHSEGEKEDSPWIIGVKHVLKQFAEALREQGVEEIEVMGKEFDHECMEAVKGQGGKVIGELRPGYRLNGKVIVAAKVELGE